MTQDFRRALANHILIADGGMGAALHARGVAYGNCFDELNLSRPEWVREIHHEFLNAGADIIQTNTFGANRQRLSAFGLADKLHAINRAGVQLARDAAGTNAFVAGSVGPLGIHVAPHGPIGKHLSKQRAREMFHEQIAALILNGGAGPRPAAASPAARSTEKHSKPQIDLLILETFRHLAELREAVYAAREAAGTGLFVIAHVSVEDDGSLADGTPLETYTRTLDEWPLDAFGVNCSSGPLLVLQTIRKMRTLTQKPLSAMPSTGLPIRDIYPCSPQSFAEYTRQLIDAGVRIIGGCCGVTAEHLRALRAGKADRIAL